MKRVSEYRYIVAMAMMCLLIVVAYFSVDVLNEDSQWIVFTAKKMLEGTTVLYHDTLEINPPLIFILNFLAVYISKLLPIGIYHSFVLLVEIFIFISLLLSLYILEKSGESRKNINIIGSTILFVLMIVPSRNFGEREHLLMIFILPYIMMMLYGETMVLSRYARSAIALFAVFGFNLKPYFFLIFLAVEGAYFMRHKRWNHILRVETAIIALSAFVYLWVIWIFFRSYFTEILPAGLHSYLFGYGNKPFYIMLAKMSIFATLFLMLETGFKFDEKSKYKMTIFYSIATASFVVYLIQNKGWHYHIIPLAIIGILMFVYYYFVLDNIDKSGKIIHRMNMIFIFLWYISDIFLVHHLKHPKIDKLLKSFDKDSSVAIYSTDVSMTFSIATKYGHTWASDSAALLFFSPFESLETDKYLLRIIENDLKKYKPDYLVFPKKYNKDKIYNFCIKNSGRINQIIKEEYTDQSVDDFLLFRRKR